MISLLVASSFLIWVLWDPSLTAVQFGRQRRKSMSNWIKWAFWQGMFGTCSRLLQKLVGRVSLTFKHTIYATFLVGVVQAIFGAIIARRRKVRLMTSPMNIIGAVSFGIMAAVSTVLSFLTFMHGGEVGVATFLITLSIILGAFIDWMFFRYPLSLEQWGGVLVAIVAGYLVLGLPSLKQVLHLPL